MPFKHTSVGPGMDRAEYEAPNSHFVDNQAQGDLIYFDGTYWERLPIGAAGLFLKSQGPGAAPTWSKVPNASLDTDVARLNLLTNPGFEIWQRGAGPYTVNGVYTADRWAIELISGSISISRESSTIDAASNYSAKIVYTKTVNNARFYQSVHDFSGQFGGKTVTFAIRAKSSVVSSLRAQLSWGIGGNWYTEQGPYHTGGGWETLTVSLNVPTGAATGTYLCGVIVEASGTFYVDNAVLVVGSVAPDYQPLHPAEEWARCYRYYEKGVADMAGRPAYGGQWLATHHHYSAYKPVNPTITISNLYVGKSGVNDTSNWSVSSTWTNQNSWVMKLMRNAGVVDNFEDTYDWLAEANP